jgi:hypothetical protein
VASQSFIKEKKNAKYLKQGPKFHSRLSPIKDMGRTKSPQYSKLDALSRTSNNEDKSTNAFSRQEQLISRQGGRPQHNFFFGKKQSGDMSGFRTKMNNTTQSWFERNPQNDRVTTPSDIHTRPMNKLQQTMSKGFTSHEILVGGDTNYDTGYHEPTTSHKAGGAVTGTSDMDVSVAGQTTTNKEHSRKEQSNDYQHDSGQVVQASTGGAQVAQDVAQRQLDSQQRCRTQQSKFDNNGQAVQPMSQTYSSFKNSFNNPFRDMS